MSSNGQSSNVNVFNPEGITPRQAGLFGRLLRSKDYNVDGGYEVAEWGEILTFGEILESFNPEGIRVNGEAGSTFEAFSLITMEEAKPFISWLCQCKEAPKKASTGGGWKGKRQNAAPSAPQTKGAAPAQPVAPPVPAQPVDLEQMVVKAVAAAMQRANLTAAMQHAAKSAPQSWICDEGGLHSVGVDCDCQPEVDETPQPTAGHQMAVPVENGMAVKLPNGEVVQLVLDGKGGLRSRKNFGPVS